MVHYMQAIRGVTSYLQEEIVDKMPGGGKRLIAGMAVRLAAGRGEQLFRAYAENPVIKASGLVDGENIDVEAICAELLRQIQKGPVRIEIPMVGAVTFGVSDVDTLYRHIKEGK